MGGESEKFGLHRQTDDEREGVRNEAVDERRTTNRKNAMKVL